MHAQAEIAGVQAESAGSSKHSSVSQSVSMRQYIIYVIFPLQKFKNKYDLKVSGMANEALSPSK